MENPSQENQTPPTEQNKDKPTTINELYAQNEEQEPIEEPTDEAVDSIEKEPMTFNEFYQSEEEELDQVAPIDEVEEHINEPIEEVEDPALATVNDQYASYEGVDTESEESAKSEEAPELSTVHDLYSTATIEEEKEAKEEFEPVAEAEAFQGHTYAIGEEPPSINQQYTQKAETTDNQPVQEAKSVPTLPTGSDTTTINDRFAQAQQNPGTPYTQSAETGPKKSWFRRFFLFAAGADQEILDQCPSDENKFIGIGGTVFFTGVLAFLSASYAIFTIFDNWIMAFLFGMVWGLMIFNLDRYIVASMKKQGSWWKDFGMAVPRLLMAILLALVISKPLELKIFEKEINAELITMEQEVFGEQENQVKSRYESQIASYQQQANDLEAELAAKRFKRDTLEMMAIQEADGTGGSGKRNLGPIYRAKKAEADQADRELKAAEAELLPMIAENRGAIKQLQDDMQNEIDELERSAYGGMAARMEGLHRLGQDSDAIWWASLMIMLLFVAVETAPIMVKLISSRSPYDFLLLEYEHGVETATREKVTLANNELKNKIQFDTETNLYRTEQEIAMEKEMIDYYLQRRKDALKTYPVQWQKPFIHSDIKDGHGASSFNSSYYPQEDQTSEKTIHDLYAESA